MSRSMTIPIFASSGGHHQQTSSRTQESSDVTGWTHNIDHDGEDGGGDNDMDFDLLAEYLLEDNLGQASGMSFEFK